MLFKFFIHFGIPPAKKEDKHRKTQLGDSKNRGRIEMRAISKIIILKCWFCRSGTTFALLGVKKQPQVVL